MTSIFGNRMIEFMDQDFERDPLYKQLQDYLNKPQPNLPARRFTPGRRYLKRIILPVVLFFLVGLPTGSLAFGFNYPKMIARVIPDTSYLKKIIRISFNGPTASSSAVSQVVTTKAPGKLICKRFTNLREALNHIDIACGLDLSGQQLNGVPALILRLTKLNDLNLSNNHLTGFSPQLLTAFSSLYSIDLSNNQIATVSASIQSATTSAKLQNLKLTGNPITDAEKQLLKQLLPKTSIIY